MSYTVKEIFYSIQGEGIRAGEPSIFIRFAGCNMRCTTLFQGFDCDTDWVGGKKMELSELLDEVKNASGVCTWVVLTGGEPALQIDMALLDALRDRGYRIAIETNGTIELSLLDRFDWITVSPKVSEDLVKQLEADELKYVMTAGTPLPMPLCLAEHHCLSPVTDRDGICRNALEWCIDLVQQNPEWRLSTQQHKLWGVR